MEGRIISLFLVLLCFHVHGQGSGKIYIAKSEDFIRTLYSRINSILDQENEDNNRNKTANIILNEMISSRDTTVLFDHITDPEVKNRSVSAQKFIEILEIKRLSSSLTFEINQVISSQLYNYKGNKDPVCQLDISISLQSFNDNNRILRTDTISFYVIFMNENVSDRKILSSRKYELEELADRDHDGVPDKEDNCPDNPGTKKNHGCPKKVLKEISVPNHETAPNTNSKTKDQNKIDISVPFHFSDLKWMGNDIDEITYTNYNISLESLSNINTIVFHLQYLGSEKINVQMKKLISNDGAEISLNNIFDVIEFSNQINENSAHFSIKLNENRELQRFIESNKN